MSHDGRDSVFLTHFPRLYRLRDTKTWTCQLLFHFPLHFTLYLVGEDKVNLIKCTAMVQTECRVEDDGCVSGEWHGIGYMGDLKSNW